MTQKGTNLKKAGSRLHRKNSLQGVKNLSIYIILNGGLIIITKDDTS